MSTFMKEIYIVNDTDLRFFAQPSFSFHLHKQTTAKDQAVINILKS
jgi:hypothetical protein